MNKSLLKITAVVLMSAPFASFAVPILTVDGSGQLLGATGLDIAGTLYDVEFVDGTCAALFDGCDEVSDFAFQTQASAEAAALSLLEQIFIDGPLGAFDTAPYLTYGCNDPTACYALTPWLLIDGVGAFSVAAYNSDSAVADLTLIELTGIEQNLGPLGPPGGATIVYAVWSVSPPAVTEPGSLFLALLGLFALWSVTGSRTP